MDISNQHGFLVSYSFMSGVLQNYVFETPEKSVRLFLRSNMRWYWRIDERSNNKVTCSYGASVDNKHASVNFFIAALGLPRELIEESNLGSMILLYVLSSEDL